MYKEVLYYAKFRKQKVRLLWYARPVHTAYFSETDVTHSTVVCLFVEGFFG